MAPTDLATHTKQLHPNTDRDELPQGWHVHIVWFGERGRSEHHSEPFDVPDATSEAPWDAELFSTICGWLKLSHQVVARRWTQDNAARPQSMHASFRTLGATFLHASAWRCMLQVHIA